MKPSVVSTELKKVFNVFLKLCSLNLKKLLIYRASFFVTFFIMGFWVISFVILVFVIFEHTNSLAGFTRGEVLLLLSFYYFFQNLSDIFYKENFEQFADIVRRGLFDLRLVKPVPNQFFTFFHEIRFDHFAGVILTIILFVYSITDLPTPISPGLFLLGLFFSLLAAWLYFSLLLFIATLSFWISKNETFNMLMWHLSQVSRYPRQIYHGIFQKIITFGFPLALLASVPTEISLKKFDLRLILTFLGITIFFSLLSNFFWKQGLKRYTSAA